MTDPGQTHGIETQVSPLWYLLCGGGTEEGGVILRTQADSQRRASAVKAEESAVRTSSPRLTKKLSVRGGIYSLRYFLRRPCVHVKDTNKDIRCFMSRMRTCTPACPNRLSEPKVQISRRPPAQPAGEARAGVQAILSGKILKRRTSKVRELLRFSCHCDVCNLEGHARKMQVLTSRVDPDRKRARRPVVFAVDDYCDTHHRQHLPPSEWRSSAWPHPPHGLSTHLCSPAWGSWRTPPLAVPATANAICHFNHERGTCEGTNLAAFSPLAACSPPSLRSPASVPACTIHTLHTNPCTQFSLCCSTWNLDCYLRRWICISSFLIRRRFR